MFDHEDRKALERVRERVMNADRHASAPGDGMVFAVLMLVRVLDRFADLVEGVVKQQDIRF